VAWTHPTALRPGPTFATWAATVPGGCEVAAAGVKS